ncbi:MAG: hypothetical protein AB1666_00925 [Pseudomonadota bacterium]|uniref:Uncharacterized protein n=1 Tax=Caldimonas aquatica TaxID=376175 RepID=A0ABY6MVQ0_9BURK|nr:hypothetical protein [Schlegelella aquatica]UZD56090.1 hypothetical protein OMP39_05805 [Schlegelella aquatica]
MRCLAVSAAAVALATAAGAALAQGQVYRCPGNHFTNALTPKEAESRGCRPVEGGNVTVVQSRAPNAGASAPAKAPAAAAPRPADSKVSPGVQQERDNEARRILEAELRKEEEQLAALKKEYNNGEPERRGDERNYQKYLDRVSELKAGIARKESDIAAIKRELAKLPPPSN